MDISPPKPLKVSKGSIEFCNVSFAYDVRSPTLSGINFKVLGGEAVAIVGMSGGGKSTIFKLIDRLYDVHKGSILIDGQDIRHITLKREGLQPLQD